MAKESLPLNSKSTQICSVQDCEKPSKNRGWCPMHYTRWLRHGDPETRVLPIGADRCTVDGCTYTTTKITSGLCNTHYLRWRRHGDVHYEEVRRTKGDTIEERFFSQVQKTETCWLWQGDAGKNGYGRIGYESKRYTTHRFSWFLAYGEFPKRMLLHSCGNRVCVNPDHLRQGTHKENSQDAIAHGTIARGERSGSAKLTEPDVLRIRELIDRGVMKKLIAAEYGVSPSVISDIRVRRTWSHI